MSRPFPCLLWSEVVRAGRFFVHSIVFKERATSVSDLGWPGP
jgi:hypothetical protein